MRVINFSGGRTSALMTLLLKPTSEDVVLFTDTGLEHEATYRFIDEFEKREGIAIQRAKYVHRRSPGLFGMAALVRAKGYLPNRAKRICTEELKIITAKRFLRAAGIQRFDSYIGFRADEKSRVDGYAVKFKKVVPHFPLYDQGVTKAMVDTFWKEKDYDLQVPSILGNCTLCFLKGKGNIIKILQHYPELAAPWIEMEDAVSGIRSNKKSAQFFDDVSYRDLLKAAESQLSLFPLENALPAYNCSCTT